MHRALFPLLLSFAAAGASAQPAARAGSDSFVLLHANVIDGMGGTAAALDRAVVDRDGALSRTCCLSRTSSWW